MRVVSIKRYTALILTGILLVTGLGVTGALAEKEDLSSYFELPEQSSEYAWRLTDGNQNSRIVFGPKESMTIRFPEETKSVVLEWYAIPEKVSVEQIGQDGTVIQTEGQRGLLEQQVLLKDDCKSLQISSASGFALSEIRFLNDSETASFREMTVPEKADLMIVLAHTADETEYLPGLIARYSGEEGISTVVVYLSSKNRAEQAEAMAAGRLYGNLNQPVFLTNDYRYLSYEKRNSATTFWGKVYNLESIVEAIRRFHPEVVVTNAANGEGGDGMHIFTSDYTLQAIDLAAKTYKFRQSAKEYGEWSVKKTYTHADDGTDDATVTTVFTREPLKYAGGKTGTELSAEAMGLYRSLEIYKVEIPDESPQFVLARTSVGEDMAKDSLFENIPPEDLVNKGVMPEHPAEPVEEMPDTAVAETVPETEAEPTPEPTPQPTYAPVLATVEPVAAKEEKEDASFGKTEWLICIAGIVTGLVLVVLFLGKNSKAWLFLALIPVVASLLIAYIYNREQNSKTAVLYVTAAPTSTVAPVITAEPVMTEKPSETEEQISNEDVSVEEETERSEFFQDPGEEEYVLADADVGKWEYRSDTLNIQIERHNEQKEDGKPIVYYVAHIRMNGTDAYRPGFGNFSEDGDLRDQPWRIARRYKAVLAITGDNLVNLEIKLKGALIRKGRVYWKGNGKVTALAMCPDMTIRTYDPSITAQTILEDGVENTYGFYPILVQDGQINPETKTHALARLNPRTGIGMIEQGHYVAIVADGRQAGYSVGLTLEEFAQLFVNEGCSVAGNLDGGVSAGMVFMGEHVNQHASSNGGNNSRQRPWTDGLLFGYSKLVPNEDDAIINTGNRNETEQNQEKYKNN